MKSLHGREEELLTGLDSLYNEKNVLESHIESLNNEKSTVHVEKTKLVCDIESLEMRSVNWVGKLQSDFESLNKAMSAVGTTPTCSAKRSVESEVELKFL